MATVVSLKTDNTKVGNIQVVNSVSSPGSDDNISTEKAVQTALGTKQGAIEAATKAAGSDGTAGDLAYDATNLYVCIATNSWKKLVLQTIT